MKIIFNFGIRSLIAFLLITVITACHKEGTGGKSSVSGHVKHHTKLIPNAVVYIKYGATEFPGSDISKYDASMTSDTNAYYEFKELYQGDYFLYGVGYDNAGPYTVTGGVAVKLKRNKHTDLDVPVTE